jgi:hypothetical protein
MNMNERQLLSLSVEDTSKKKKMIDENRVCSVCEKNIHKFICSRCHNDNHARYCGPECQKEAWSYHKYSCFPIPSNLYKDSDNTLLRQGIKMNLFSRYQAMCTRLRERDESDAIIGLREDEKGHYLIYKGIVEIILKGTYEDYAKRNAIHVDITEGCKVVAHQTPSPFENKDDYLWMFIPAPLARIVRKHFVMYSSQ